jgi:hypothetical protein
MHFTTGNNSIDALLAGSWNTVAGDAVSLDYSFLAALGADAPDQDAAGFAAMTDGQQSGVRAALAAWAAVANVTFTQLETGGDIQLGTNSQANATAGYAYHDASGVAYVFTNNDAAYNYSFKDGGYGILTLIHELGHALGLKHPGAYNAGSDVIPPGPFLPADTDNRDYSIMSYNDSAGALLHHQYAITPMLYDIQAIQYMYGANMSYHTGDDTYKFAKASAMQCIWDAGGADTFDFSACTGATVIDLNAGSFSSTAPGYNNISIAYNVTIEKAIAGNGGSTIYANDAGDLIIGGKGVDIIHEGAGNDVITGGGGRDTVIYKGTWESYTLSAAAGVVTVAGEGVDTLSGITNIQFSDVIFHPNGYTFRNGGGGNDVFVDSVGDEVFSGGAGIDVLKLGGKAATYNIHVIGSSIDAQSATGEISVLSNVERLVFADGALALDFDGAAGQLYRLYEAMFNRTPDAAGMGYWLDYLDHGGNVNAIATGFVTSTEFTAIYGANATDNTFVTALYNNVLHRASDQAGLDYWVNALHAGIARADVLVGFSESAENIVAVAKIIPVDIAYTPWVA